MRCNGYMISSKCFTRKFPNINKYLEIYKSEIKISLFDIYIPHKINNSKYMEKNNIFIQLSGGRNPIVQMEENIIYANLCLTLTKCLANIFKKLIFTICINPYILQNLDVSAYCFDNIKIIASITPTKNFTLMEHSIGIFTSPGLETIYEAIYTNCPVFLLPEQNAGQFSIFEMLNQNGYDPNRFLINELYPERQKFPGENDAHNIYKIIKDYILPSNIRMASLYKRSINFINNMMVQHKRDAYLQMSLEAISVNSKENPFTKIDNVSDYIRNHT